MVVDAPTRAAEPDQASQLHQRASSALALGDWPGASRAAEECLKLAEHTGRPEPAALGAVVAGIVAAVRGDAAEARALMERSERLAVSHDMTGILGVVQLGRGIEALSGDRYEEAWAYLKELLESVTRCPAWVRLAALSHLAEVGLHCDTESTASTVLATIEGQSHLASPEMLQGVTAYARAITTREDSVEETFDRAMAECPVDRVFDRARINLARGVCLRRERRVSESRLPLHEAMVTFDRLGATVWADQARRELRATGVRRSHRGLGDIGALTAQEFQIVRLAAEGMSNREIGLRLYLSHRTIGSHLYRAYPKLGVAARCQLRDVLAQQAGTLETAGR